MQEAKRQKSTKKKRNVRDRKLTSSSAVNSSNDEWLCDTGISVWNPSTSSAFCWQNQ